MCIRDRFRRVLKDSAPVHVIDTRAQADALILGALEELQVLDAVSYTHLQFYRRHLQRRAETHWEETPSVSKATTTPNGMAPARKPILAATPQPREVRRPNPEDMTLNDPTNI